MFVSSLSNSRTISSIDNEFELLSSDTSSSSQYLKRLVPRLKSNDTGLMYSISYMLFKIKRPSLYNFFTKCACQG